ncbi:MAG: hypothetical protein LBK99_24410 [Opitutaceae bacterium]|jgi:hypothetical protein|nr:hypothetical protein [Opitutaceae bacterium]
MKNTSFTLPRALAAAVLVNILILAGASRTTAATGVVASSVDAQPGNVYLGNASFLSTGNGSDGVQARKRGADGTDLRGVYQAFTWNTADKLSSVGLLVSPSSTTSVDSSFHYTADQTWTLEILQLRSSVNGTIDGTVLTETVLVETSGIVAGKYLNLAFSTPVTLTTGFTYAINLYPSDTVDQRVLFAIAGSKSALGGGQTLGPSTAFNFPAATTDLTFYITTTPMIPEPSHLATGLGCVALLAMMTLRHHRHRRHCHRHCRHHTAD